MSVFLLDTDICVFYFRDLHQVRERIERVGWSQCRLSEATVGELMYGAECSLHPAREYRRIELLCEKAGVLPVSEIWKTYAEEKARLRRLGTPIADFDLLIGATAIRHGLTLVTNNTKHFQRMENLTVENWTMETDR